MVLRYLHSNLNKLCGKPRYIPPPLRTVLPSSSRPIPALRLRRLASSSWGRHEYSRCTRQTDR